MGNAAHQILAKTYQDVYKRQGYSLYLSFLKYKGYGEATFVGFQNYKALLTYALFWKSLGNTAFYFLAHFVPVMAGAFLFALAMQSSYIGRAQKVIKPV